MAKYEIIAYCGDRMLPEVQPKDMEKLTVMNIAFGLVRDGRVSTAHLQNLSCLPAIRAMNPELKILLSVGGWGAGGFSDAACTAEGRALFASTAGETVAAHGLDGIDIDWEYPCHWQAGIDARPEDKHNFTLLMEALRAELDRRGAETGRRCMLTMAAGADRYFCEGTEMDLVQAYCDYVQLMTYDMRGGFQVLTGHHAGLYNTTGDLFRISADSCARDFEAHGVPREKLVLGAAFYSRKWTGVENAHNGLLMPAKSTGGGGGNWAKLYHELIGKNGFTRYWDDEAKAPWLFDGETFYSYDDPDSLRCKCEYIKERGLKGLMYWVYLIDPADVMLPAIYDTLHGE